jgi:glycine/serine hydroxymethyltransferase
VRIGTAAMTTRGYEANDFCRVAIKIHEIIQKLSQNNQPIVEYDPNSITVGGEYQLDPEVYRDVEMWKNVTVVVSENVETGEMQVSWKRQEDTENISDQIEE